MQGSRIKVEHPRDNLQIEYYEVIDASGLFDFDYYLSKLKLIGLMKDVGDPIWHYIEKGDKLRISPNPLFDCEFYHFINQDVQNAGISALFHFAKYGWEEGRHPHPLFDTNYVLGQMEQRCNPLKAYLTCDPGLLKPHPLFDERYVIKQLREEQIVFTNALSAFLSQRDSSINPNRNFDMREYEHLNPDISGVNAYYHYVTIGKAEGRKATSVEISVASLMPQILSASALDCDILPPNVTLQKVPRIKAMDAGRGMANLMAVLLSSQANSYNDIFVFIPCMMIGGAEKVLSQFLEVAIEKHGKKVTVFITDSDRSEALERLPSGDNIKIFEVSSLINSIEPDNVLITLGLFLQLARPKNILLMNSLVGWDLVERFGAAFKAFTKFHAFAFCYDYGPDGRRCGYAWTHMPRCIPSLTTIISDNTRTTEQFAADLFLDEGERDRFYVLKQPIRSAEIPLFNNFKLRRSRRSAGRPTILWAGRLHRQKNISFAFEVAREMDEADFLFAGFNESFLARESLDLTNVTFCGTYNDFNELPLSECQAFIHTADWDGLPNVLLEAASAGVLILARNVGGVSDLVNDSTGWLVDTAASPSDYAKVLRKALSDPELTTRKKENMTLLLRANHTWSQFETRVERLMQRFQ